MFNNKDGNTKPRKNNWTEKEDSNKSSLNK